MSASDNGICPNCARADAVKRTHTELYAQPAGDTHRFECVGCGARWAGVRSERSIRRRVKAPINVPSDPHAQHLDGLDTVRA